MFVRVGSQCGLCFLHMCFALDTSCFMGGFVRVIGLEYWLWHLLKGHSFEGLSVVRLIDLMV